MEILKYGITFIVGVLTIIVMDSIWLGGITKGFIIEQFGSLIEVKDGKFQINLLAGIITWCFIVLALLVFVVSKYDNYRDIALYGAILGLCTYAIYDLTNLTFIKDYPFKFVFVDIAWGTFLTSVVSAVCFTVYNYLNKLF